MHLWFWLSVEKFFNCAFVFCIFSKSVCLWTFTTSAGQRNRCSFLQILKETFFEPFHMGIQITGISYIITFMARTNYYIVYVLVSDYGWIHDVLRKWCSLSSRSLTMSLNAHGLYDANSFSMVYFSSTIHALTWIFVVDVFEFGISTLFQKDSHAF